MNPSSANRWLVALLAPWAAMTAWFWFLCDDAYITFRFARNLASGNGLVFNIGESPPVEGYSNFAWLLVAAALEVVGAPVEWVIPALSALTGAGLIAATFLVAHRRLAVPAPVAFAALLPLAFSPVVAVWSTSGLATMPFALLVFLLFDQLVLSEHEPGPASALIAALLLLIRTEGWGWILVIAVIAVWVHRTQGHPSPLRRLLLAIVPAAVVWAAYNGWRLSYYGTVVPNTALVKVGFGASLLGRGIRYVLLFGLSTLVPVLVLLPAPLAWRQHGARGLAIVAMALAFPAYGVVVGGDFMPFGRLILPSLPFGALVLSVGLDRLRVQQGVAAGAVLAALAVLPGLDLHVAPESVRAALHFRLSDPNFLSEWGKWDNMVRNTEGFMRRGRALASFSDPGDAVVSGAVGAIGYYAPEVWIWDQYGLVTKEVAYRPFHAGPLRESPGHDKRVDAEFFARYAPRFLYSRAVKGRPAAYHMKDSIEHWAVDPLVMDLYVPDFVEVDLGDDQRHFLVMVRRARLDEDPKALWSAFEGRRTRLHAELREELEDEEREASDDG